MEVNENDRTVEIRKSDGASSYKVAYWYFDDLEKELHQKHPATLWVKAESRMNGDVAEFRYTEIELTEIPSIYDLYFID
ncbi:MAG: MvaI/BcnI family restriction endonuclease [Streptococcus salivarius]